MTMTNPDPKLPNSDHLTIFFIKTRQWFRPKPPFARGRQCFPQSPLGQHGRRWQGFSSSQGSPWCRGCPCRGCAGSCQAPAASWTWPATLRLCVGCAGLQALAPTSPSVRRSLVVQVVRLIWSLGGCFCCKWQHKTRKPRTPAHKDHSCRRRYHISCKKGVWCATTYLRNVTFVTSFYSQLDLLYRRCLLNIHDCEQQFHNQQSIICLCKSPKFHPARPPSLLLYSWQHLIRNVFQGVAPSSRVQNNASLVVGDCKSSVWISLFNIHE